MRQLLTGIAAMAVGLAAIAATGIIIGQIAIALLINYLGR